MRKHRPRNVKICPRCFLERTLNQILKAEAKLRITLFTINARSNYNTKGSQVTGQLDARLKSLLLGGRGKGISLSLRPI